MLKLDGLLRHTQGAHKPTAYQFQRAELNLIGASSYKNNDIEYAQAVALFIEDEDMIFHAGVIIDAPQLMRSAEFCLRRLCSAATTPTTIANLCCIRERDG